VLCGWISVNQSYTRKIQEIRNKCVPRVEERNECGMLHVSLRIFIHMDIEGEFYTSVLSAALGVIFVRVSNRLISFSSFSIPEPFESVWPLVPCLSNRYVKRFFLSSARPSRRAKRCVSSRRTSCAAIMEAAADSRTTRDVVSFRAYQNHC
jgi:hypothetical protein